MRQSEPIDFFIVLMYLVYLLYNLTVDLCVINVHCCACSSFFIRCSRIYWL